jgi:hypothetical protein
MTECSDVVLCLIALQGIYEMVEVYAYPLPSSSLFGLLRIFWLHSCV